jgi:hypothetical protein
MSGREETTGVSCARDQGACTAADPDAVRYEVARADVLADAAMHAFECAGHGAGAEVGAKTGRRKPTGK